MVKKIGGAIKKSRSLISIHLSLNPGLSSTVGGLTMKEFLKENIPCVYSKHGSLQNTLDLKKFENISRRLDPEYKHSQL